MALDTAKVTGILYAPDGRPIASETVMIRALTNEVTGVTGGGRVPSEVTAATNASGEIGVNDGSFAAGVNLSIGKYILTAPGAARAYNAMLTIDQNMIDAGMVDLQVTLEGAPPPAIVTDAQKARDAAQAAQAAAETAQAAAETAETAAAGSATTAQSAETNAAASETAAQGYRDDAQAIKDNMAPQLVQMATAFTNSQARYVEQHAFS